VAAIYRNACAVLVCNRKLYIPNNIVVDGPFDCRPILDYEMYIIIIYPTNNDRPTRMDKMKLI